MVPNRATHHRSLEKILKDVFHKFYFVHSSILCFICESCSTIVIFDSEKIFADWICSAGYKDFAMIFRSPNELSETCLTLIIKTLEK